MNSTLPSLQPPKQPASPAEFRPVLIIDSREQVPLPIWRLQAITGTLQSGDYSLVGAESVFAVEKKSLGDLVSSLTTERARFERELHRLRGFRFKRLLVLAAPCEITQRRYLSRATPQSIWGSLAALEIRYNVPVVFEPDAEAAGRQVERWAVYFAREVLKTTEALIKGHAHPDPVPEPQPTP